MVPDRMASGIFHRIISGDEGININFATRTDKFDISDNFNIYDLNTRTGEYKVLKKGAEDQPDLAYESPNDEIKSLFKQD